MYYYISHQSCKGKECTGKVVFESAADHITFADEAFKQAFGTEPSKLSYIGVTKDEWCAGGVLAHYSKD